MKIDDDAFLFVNNLKRFVQFYNPMVPHYLGHTLIFRWEENIIFNSGIAYALSKASVQKLAPLLRNMPKLEEQRIVNRDRCMDRKGAGSDTSVGICLRSIGINPDNTLDENYGQRFLTFRRESHRDFGREKESWYWKFKHEKTGQYQTCCADEVIAAHEYKGTGKYFENIFDKYEKEEQATKYDEGMIKLPPKPTPFLYHSEIPFKIHEYRNIISKKPPKDHEPFFTGWKLSSE